MIGETEKHMRIVYWLLVGFSFSLSGCGVLFGDDGYFRNREDDYLKADSVEPLQIPAHLNADAVGELYPVAPLTEEDTVFAQDTDRFETPRPEPLSASAMLEQVRIQRLDDDRWILVNVAPGNLWPRIRNFLNQNDLTVESTDVELGLMETSWLSFRDDPDRIDRYRIRIDRGVHPDTSEIHILHMSVNREEATQAELTRWPERSSSEEREAFLLDELAATLASEEIEGAGGTSLIAQDIGGEVKSRIATVETEPVLRLRLNRPRALGTLNHAAEQEGFTIYERDSEAGVFYLGYRKPRDREPGRIARWFGAERAPAPPPTEFSLEDLRAALPDNLLSNPEQAERAREQLGDVPGFLLVLTENEEGVLEARLRDAYGQRLSTRRTREMLSVLRKNLI